MPTCRSFPQMCLLAFLTLCSEAMGQLRPLPERTSPFLFEVTDHDSGGSFRVMTADSTAFLTWMSDHIPHADVRRDVVPNVYRVSGANGNDAAMMMRSPALIYLEHADHRAMVEGSVPGLDLSVNSVTTVHHLYPGLDGSDLHVSVKENPFDKNDMDLTGRVLAYASMPIEHDQHATMMATIISGAGNSSPRSKGVAWKSSVGYADFSNLMPEPASILQERLITVQNHSYGVGVENYYGIESYAYDDQCTQYPSIVHVFSAGNAGGESANSGIYQGIPGFANLTGQFKTSKNGVVVGGADREGRIEPLSSRGPTADGRLKPEVVAYGNGGTSNAAAIVSGVCLLAQDAHRDAYGSLPSSELVKAALINSADDAGSPHVDYSYGYGNVDALGLVETILNGNFFTGSVSEGDPKSFVIAVPDNAYRLKVTLAWIDPPGVPGAVSALVSDLDLRVVESATSDIYMPWVLSSYPHIDSLREIARRGEDHINNVEQVTIDKPSAGEFTIKVVAFDTPGGSQSFSIAYEVQQGLKWIYPTASDAVEAGSNVLLRWQWGGDDEVARIEWKIAGADSWEDIGDAKLQEGYIAWQVPDVNEVIDLRVVLSGESVWSESIVVSRPPDLQIGYHCEDEVLFFWPDVSSSQYALYRLSGAFLEPVGILSDTFFTVDVSIESSRYFSVVPLVNGRSGVRAETLGYGSDLPYCYLKSFLARELVSDSVYLDVVLASNIGLRAMFLERESSGDFQAIAERAPVDNTNFTFYDSAPLPGRNRYRIRIERTNDEVIFSDIEEVWFMRRRDHHYFPNPLSAGEILNLVIEADPVTIEIYDAYGRIVKNAREDGEMKNIDTTGLKPGVFFLKIFTGVGEWFAGRIVIR